MLYVTTRNNQDTFTAQRALHENRGPDGGFFLPFHSPSFSACEIAELSRKPFNQRLADILNFLFGTRLTGWDLDFTIGRNPVRFAELHHRIIVAETWHNTKWSYLQLENCIARHLDVSEGNISDWLRIAIRIAVLLSIYAELIRLDLISDNDGIDISVVSGDFSVPISAKYARNWGLPINNIICCCNENSEIWNLLCHGQMRTDTVCVPTQTPLADTALPEDLERLVHDCCGVPETFRYLECCQMGRMYHVDEDILSKLREGMFVSVVSSRRVLDTVPNVYGTSGYRMSLYTALAYAGLLDYRVKQKESRYAVVLSDICPEKKTSTIENEL